MLLNGTPGWAQALGGLTGLAGAIISGNQQRKEKQAALDRQKQIDAQNEAYRQSTLANTRSNLAINAANAGMVYDPQTGTVKNWEPPATSVQPSTPAPLPAATPPPSATSSRPSEPAAQTGGIDPGLTQQVAIAQAQYGSLMDAYKKASDEADGLEAAHAPKVLVDRARTKAKQILDEAGTWFTKFQTAQKTVTETTEKNAAAAEKKSITDFEAGLKYPPNWGKMSPQQQIAYLQQRLNAAEQHHDKEVASATNAEISRLQRDISENRRATEAERHDAQRDRTIAIALARFNRGASGRGSGNAPSDAANAVYDRALRARTPQEALKIIDDPRNGLNYRERTELRQAIRDQKEPAAAKDPSVSGQASTLRGEYGSWRLQNPGGSISDFRKQAKDEGYSDQVINQVIPSGSAAPAAPAPAATPAPRPSSAPQAKTQMHNGKLYYLHADGNYYLTP